MQHLLNENRLSVLESLNKIKVSDVYTISEMLNRKLQSHTVRRTLKKLEEYKIVKSMVMPGYHNKKFYIPTKKTQDYFSENILITSPSNLYHNVMLGRTMFHISMYSNIENYTILGDMTADKNTLVPDATMSVRNKGKCHLFAVEMELTRKTVERYVRKFKNYNNDKAYDGAIFIFDNEGVYNSYKQRIVENFADINQCNIFLLFINKLSIDFLSLIGNKFFIYGKETRVQALIGEKQDV
jgi:hypothetical protein